MFLIGHHALYSPGDCDLVLFELVLNNQEALVVHEAVVTVEVEPVYGFVYGNRIRY